MKYTLALLSLPFIVKAIPQSNPQSTCYQDCANSNTEQFACPGIDVACYCDLDNGEFVPKFKSCLQQNCPDVYGIANLWLNCPEPTPTPEPEPTEEQPTVTQVTTETTITTAKEDTATITGTGTVTETNTITQIQEDTTTVFTQTVVDLTTYTVESGTTRMVTLTTTVVADVTVTDGGNTTLTTTIPTSTDFTTITTNDTTITTAVSTHYGTSIIVENNTATVTTEQTDTASPSESPDVANTLEGASKWSLAVALGLAGLFAL